MVGFLFKNYLSLAWKINFRAKYKFLRERKFKCKFLRERKL